MLWTSFNFLLSYAPYSFLAQYRLYCSGSGADYLTETDIILFIVLAVNHSIGFIVFRHFYILRKLNKKAENNQINDPSLNVPL